MLFLQYMSLVGKHTLPATYIYHDSSNSNTLADLVRILACQQIAMAMRTTDHCWSCLWTPAPSEWLDIYATYFICNKGAPETFILNEWL